MGVRDEGNEEEEVERARRQCQVMLVDFLPMLFGKSKAIKTGEHFLNFVFKFIRDFFDSGGDTCVILIDEPALVPLAKGLTLSFLISPPPPNLPSPFSLCLSLHLWYLQHQHRQRGTSMRSP